MTKPLYKRYGEKTPDGLYAFNAFFGMVLYLPQNDDSFIEDCDLICAWESNGQKYGFHRHKIHYTSSGRSYVRKGNIKVYLDETIRADL